MARKSYGGDMFSPLRNDLSCSEVFKSSESDCSLELSKTSCEADHSKSKEKLSIKVTESRKNSSNECDCEKVIKMNDSVFESSLTSEDVKHSRISYITTRNKKSHLNENDVSEDKEMFQMLDQKKSSKKSKKDKKDSLIKHITLRSDSCDASLKSKIKQRDSYTSTLSSLAEEKFEIEPICTETVSSEKKLELLSNPLKEKVKVPSSLKIEINKGHSNKITHRSNSEKQGKSMANTKVEIKNVKSVVDREVQTDVVMSDASFVKKCYTCKQMSKDVDVSNPQNQAQQIQANIIEKLVKDTVSYEFEEVRQMMYLMQLSLFKRLDRITDGQQSSDNTILLRVIEELVEENRRLKQFINVSPGK